MRLKRFVPSSIVTAAVAIAVTICIALPALAQQPPGEATPAQVAAAAVVPEYAAFLGTLDPSASESVLRARDELLRRYANASNRQREAAFRQFTALADKALRQLSRTFFHSSPALLLDKVCAGLDGPARAERPGSCLANAFDTLLRSTDSRIALLRTERASDVVALTRLRAAGLRFYSSEGDWYIEQDFAFLAAAAGELKLDDLRAWTSFRANEDRQVVAEDAGLQLTWEQLRARLARWEAFGRSHPMLPEVATDVQPHIRWLVAVYICGLPNTPAYGHNEPVLDREIKTSYGYFLAENRLSSYYHVIDGVVTRLALHYDRPTAGLVAFLRSELTDPSFKFWIDWLESRLKPK